MRRDKLREQLLLMLTEHSRTSILAGLPPLDPGEDLEEQEAFEKALDLMGRLIAGDDPEAVREAIAIINGD